RVRQHQVNEWHEQPVVRQFVDEIRSAGAALHTRALQILLAELASLVRRRIENGFRVRSELSHENRNIGKLRSPFDQAMRREDLFDESRSGARHSDDEDWIGRSATAGALSEGIPCECR